MKSAILEILTIRIKPGMILSFHETYLRESLPLQRKWHIEVVSHGPSLQDDDAYVVVRYFSSLEERSRITGEFYASDDWQKGPRAVLLGMIENIATAVIPADQLNRSKASVPS